MPCARTTVSISRLFHRKSSKGASVLFAFSIFLSALCYRWWHTPCTHCLKVLCLPHCFRMLHRGVISKAVLNCLKKQIFHLANACRQSPPASAERAEVWMNLQESLARGEQTQVGEGSLDLPKPFPPARPSTIPRVILRKKRGQASSVATGHSSSLILADVSSSTPKRSPVKAYHSPPSQVEHNFCTAVTNFQQTPEP